jgi:hypothetical protein
MFSMYINKIRIQMDYYYYYYCKHPYSTEPSSDLDTQEKK